MLISTSVFFTLLILFCVSSSSLLLMLLLLEVLGFVVLFYIMVGFANSNFSDFLTLAVFAVLVIGGVIGLSGLINLVSFSGSDYTALSSFSKC